MNIFRGCKTLAEAKAIYRQACFTLHPDCNPGDPNAGEKMKQLNAAYAKCQSRITGFSIEMEEEAEELKVPPDGFFRQGVLVSPNSRFWMSYSSAFLSGNLIVGMGATVGSVIVITVTPSYRDEMIRRTEKRKGQRGYVITVAEWMAIYEHWKQYKETKPYGPKPSKHTRTIAHRSQQLAAAGAGSSSSLGHRNRTKS